MGSSPVKVDISGVWEATGAVANDEFRGPLDFLSTSSFLPFSESLREICILNIFEVCEAERLLVHRAGGCGKAVGVAAYNLISGPFTSSVSFL